MSPLFLSETQVAALLGRKKTWLFSHRASLEASGFPKKDAVVGLTLAADVENWVARRRVLAQRESAERHHHEAPSTENLENL